MIDVDAIIDAHIDRLPLAETEPGCPDTRGLAAVTLLNVINAAVAAVTREIEALPTDEHWGAGYAEPCVRRHAVLAAVVGRGVPEQEEATGIRVIDYAAEAERTRRHLSDRAAGKREEAS